MSLFREAGSLLSLKLLMHNAKITRSPRYRNFSEFSYVK